MRELLTVFPELPLLVAVLVAAALFRAVRWILLAVVVLVVVAVVLGSAAHCALVAGALGCAPAG